MRSKRGIGFLRHWRERLFRNSLGEKLLLELFDVSAFAPAIPNPSRAGRRDLPSSDYGMASKTAQQEEEGFIGVIGNSQVGGGSS